MTRRATKIALCVGTRDRPQGVLRLLRSLESIKVPPDAEIEVIVVENSQVGSTQQLVEQFARSSRNRMRYFLEERPGIASARNRSVHEANDADFYCFVDDDQHVDPEWLVELLKCQKEFDSAGAWGQNPPIFARKVPAYVAAFHQPEIYEYGTVVKQAYTNCLLLQKQWIDRVDGPFDERLNFMGGEDTLLTSTIAKLGGEIRFTPYAKAYELVPDARTKPTYLLKRTFRSANSRYYLQSLRDRDFRKLSIVPRLTVRMCYGLLLSIPFLFVRSNRLLGFLKISDALSGFMFLFGFRIKIYAAPEKSSHRNAHSSVLGGVLVARTTDGSAEV